MANRNIDDILFNSNLPTDNGVPIKPLSNTISSISSDKKRAFRKTLVEEPQTPKFHNTRNFTTTTTNTEFNTNEHAPKIGTSNNGVSTLSFYQQKNTYQQLQSRPNTLNSTKRNNNNNKSKPIVVLDDDDLSDEIQEVSTSTTTTHKKRKVDSLKSKEQSITENTPTLAIRAVRLGFPVFRVTSLMTGNDIWTSDSMYSTYIEFSVTSAKLVDDKNTLILDLNDIDTVRSWKTDASIAFTITFQHAMVFDQRLDFMNGKTTVDVYTKYNPTANSGMSSKMDVRARKWKHLTGPEPSTRNTRTSTTASTYFSAIPPNITRKRLTSVSTRHSTASSIKIPDHDSDFVSSPARPSSVVERLRRPRSPEPQAPLEPIIVEIDDDDDDDAGSSVKTVDSSGRRGSSLRANLPLFHYPFTGANSVTIYEADTHRLKPGEFLDDSLINFYLLYLQERLEPHIAKNVHIFNTLFYKKLSTKERKGQEVLSPYQRVKKWLSKVKPFEKDYLIIPINESAHWYLIIVAFPHHLLTPANTPTSDIVEIDIPAPSNSQSKGYEKFLEMFQTQTIIAICDSLHGKRTTSMNNIKRLLTDMACDLNPDLKPIVDARYAKNLTGFHARLPAQPNHCDCGVYLLHYVELFLRSPAENMFSMLGKDKEAENWFQQSDIVAKRVMLKNLVWEIHEQWEKYKRGELGMAETENGSGKENTKEAEKEDVDIEGGVEIGDLFVDIVKEQGSPDLGDDPALGEEWVEVPRKAKELPSSLMTTVARAATDILSRFTQ